MSRNCVHSADKFCYTCGEVTFARQRKAVTAIVKKAYRLYFWCKIGDQDKSWAPHICWHKCATNLSQWLNGRRHAMPFAVPVVWREPSNHATDCYFCTMPPVDNSVSKYTICCLSSSARRRNFRSRTSERIYYRFRQRGQKRVELGFYWAADVYWTTRLTR
jgi:hypothetical protein